MKKKKYGIIIISAAIFFCLIFSCLTLYNSLIGYTKGFNLKGTYQTSNELLDKTESLVFSQEFTDGKNVVYYYDQAGINQKGTYLQMPYPNLYQINIYGSALDGNYILVNKRSIYIITEQSVLEYEKKSNNAILIETER